MPSKSLMASVRMTYPFGPLATRISLVVVAFGLANSLLGAEFDGLPGGRLEFRWDVGCYRHRVAVFGQAEDFRTQRDAHAVTATTLVVDRDFHAGVNSTCSSVRPRRM